MAEKDRGKAEVRNFRTHALSRDMWGFMHGRMISGVEVKSDKGVIWEKKVYEFFQTPKILCADLDIRKPFYEKRLLWASKRAERIADRENRS